MRRQKVMQVFCELVFNLQKKSQRCVFDGGMQSFSVVQLTVVVKV